MHKVILFHLGSKGKATEKNKILPPIFVNPSRPPKKANILQFKRAVKARGRIASQSPPSKKRIITCSITSLHFEYIIFGVGKNSTVLIDLCLSVAHLKRWFSALFSSHKPPMYLHS